jgi:hypothetical protein
MQRAPGAHLALFRRRPFPLPWQQIAPLVRLPHECVGHSTLTALGQFQDLGVHPLGITLLAESFRVRGALGPVLLRAGR